MRRAALLALALGALAAGAWLLVQPPERPRNLILISVDTLRQDRLGAYGYARPTTPALDALAARGVVFEDATAPSSWTVPSHVSLLTGLTPRSHGVANRVQHMNPAFETIARWLEQHGYDTAAIVNTILLGPSRGFQNGFGHFELVARRPRDFSAPEIHRRALAWLDRPREVPFFLFLHYYDVHSDYAPDDEYRAMFAEPYDGKATGSTEQLKAARLGQLVLTPEDAKHLSNLYDAEIRQLDDELGRFLAELERRGLLEETAILVTSDHGEEFLEHGGVLHGKTLHGELVRVPLLAAGPGVPVGRRVAGPVSLVDVFPTAMGLLGVDPPPYVEGIDLASRGWTGPPEERPVFFSTDWWLGLPDGEWKRAVQSDGWKLHYAHPSGALELYDVAADPGELHDRAAGDPGRVQTLRTLLAPNLAAGDAGGAPTIATPEETEQLRALGYLE